MVLAVLRSARFIVDLTSLAALQKGIYSNLQEAEQCAQQLAKPPPLEHSKMKTYLTAGQRTISDWHRLVSCICLQFLSRWKDGFKASVIQRRESPRARQRKNNAIGLSCCNVCETCLNQWNKNRVAPFVNQKSCPARKCLK